MDLACSHTDHDHVSAQPHKIMSRHTIELVHVEMRVQVVMRVASSRCCCAGRSPARSLRFRLVIAFQVDGAALLVSWSRAGLAQSNLMPAAAPCPAGSAASANRPSLRRALARGGRLAHASSWHSQNVPESWMQLHQMREPPLAAGARGPPALLEQCPPASRPSAARQCGSVSTAALRSRPR